MYGVDGAWLEQHAGELMHRYANRMLGDTIFRLGRDPLRKLAPKDRLVGAARLAEKAGVKPDALAWGIAAGYCFDAADDPMAAEMQERIRKQGFAPVLADVSGIQLEEPLGVLVLEHYHTLKEKGFV
jgi:mannitol-1-phosphate 5-dehydrogenase